MATSPIADKLYQALTTEIQPVDDSYTDWLTSYSPSMAFATVIGAGPWKVDRRAKIQSEARGILANRNLNVLTKAEIKQMYPLTWQRQIIAAAITHCVDFDDIINTIKTEDSVKAWETFNTIVEYPRKVTCLFARDYLMLNCIPVDRHTERWLTKHKLPTDHEELFKLSLEIEKHYHVHTRKYARAIFLAMASNP